MSSTVVVPPLPLLDEQNRDWWQACKRHELAIQRCQECGALVHPPRLVCPKCQSFSRELVRASGKGKVYSFIIVRTAAHRAFENVPYNVALVELEEGVRIVSNMVDCPPEDVHIGMPVEVVFEDVSDDIALPKFRRESSRR